MTPGRSNRQTLPTAVEGFRGTTMGMTHKARKPLTLLVGAVALLTFAGLAISQVAPPVVPSMSNTPMPNPGEERGFTEPSDQSDLSFPVPGVVSKVLVK